MRREKPIAGPLVAAAFTERADKAISIIQQSNIQFLEVGFFGSYARNEYKATSDIDIIVIVEELPSPCDRSDLRFELEDLEVDVHFMPKAYFENDESLFTKCVREDYVRRL